MTTQGPGCCAGDSLSATKACEGRDDETTCARMSSCHWVEGEDADCAWVATYAPEEPGCCAVSDAKSPDTEVWREQCRGYWTEDMCLRREDVHGNARCAWTSVPSEYDCSLLETTPPPKGVTGCCAANKRRDVDMCAAREDVDECECDQCFWVGGRYADCAWETSTTTRSPRVTRSRSSSSSEEYVQPEPKGKDDKKEKSKDKKEKKDKDGCCVVDDGYEDVAGDMCTECMDEGECDGKRQCKWAPQDKCGYEGERLLFGEEESVQGVSVLDAQVQLSTVLLMLAAAGAVYAVSRWCAARRDGYKKVVAGGDEWETQTIY